MRALIRDRDETITEKMDVRYFINWETGYPLTNAKWFGGPYTLVENYVPPTENTPAQYDEVIVEDPEPIVQEEEVVEDDDYVVIGGVRYSKAELRSLIE